MSSVFSLSGDDVFALPKGLALGAIAGAAVLLWAASAAAGRGRTRRPPVSLDRLLLWAFADS